MLLRATAADGRELVRGVDAGSGRADVLSAGLRWSATADEGAAEPDGHRRAGRRTTTVCLVVSNSFAPRPGTRAEPGMPVELTIDVVASRPPRPRRTWGAAGCCWLLLTLAGLLTGLVAGLLTRWWVATWREN